MEQWELLSAGVDWLTATARHDGNARLLYEQGKQIAELEMRSGYRLRESGSSGYRGFSSGRAFYGWRLDGCCIRLSSEAAKLYAARVVPRADKIARLDLQATARSLEELPDLAEREYRSRGVPLGVGRQPVKKSLYLASDGGSTLYLGSPASDQRGRLYNKSVESNGALPPGTWRAEVQYRDDRAGQIAGSLEAGSYSQDGIVSTVASWFRERGTELGFSAPGVPWSTRLYPDDVDDDRKLIYLTHTIRPMLEGLVVRRTREEVMFALGLADPLKSDVLGLSDAPSFYEAEERWERMRPAQS